MEYLGLFSALLFVLSAFPVAWSAIKGREGPPMLTTILIVGGSLGMIIYEIANGARGPVLLNLGSTFTCWAVDLLCKIYRRVK
jgi:hypothetical protein